VSRGEIRTCGIEGGEVGHAPAQKGHSRERLGPHSEEPQTGHCHWTLGSAKGRRQGAEAQECQPKEFEPEELQIDELQPEKHGQKAHQYAEVSEEALTGAEYGGPLAKELR
jgi:hypothetical protein